MSLLKVLIPLLFLNVLISAALLFVAEPLIGKMVLPLFGGAPSVWNTCLVFFQITVLAGYLYAHVIGMRIRYQFQIVIHILLLCAPVFVLPFALPESFAREFNSGGSPEYLLSLLLLMMAALPLFVISSTAPIIQRWFSLTKHHKAADPYFLYAASNAGSLIALLSFPFLIEPNFSTEQISSSWMLIYFCYLILSVLGGVILYLLKQKNLPVVAPSKQSHLTHVQRLYWILLSAVPSSLMMGVTTYISTDIGALPLLWIVPLALYLVSFIVAFSKYRPVQLEFPGRVLSLLSVTLIIAFITESNYPALVLIPLHLILFFSAALVLHCRLAADRPAVDRLTEFYLIVSVGGVLGGIFNTLIAPQLFTGVWEYPLLMIAACMLRGDYVAQTSHLFSKNNIRDLLLLLGLTSALLMLGWYSGLTPGRFNTVAVFGVPALLVYRRVQYPVRFGFMLCGLLLSSAVYRGVHGQIVFKERNFFGTLRVTELDGYRSIVHGNIRHGRQKISEMDRCIPLAYYHQSGPSGELLRRYQHEPEAFSSAIGVVGLGSGALACYALPSQEWTFFEINPAVNRVAFNPAYFTFLKQSPTTKIQSNLGDARLKLAQIPAGKFDLLVLDAFSSDSIPLHLLTREALQLYRSKLTPNGILLFHISNLHLELAPVLAGLGASLDMEVLSWKDQLLSADQLASGRDPSEWVVMSADSERLSRLTAGMPWERINPQSNQLLWTDSYSNVFTVIQFR